MIKIKELIPVYTEEMIKERVSQMGREIAQDLPEGDLICVCVLNGAVFFFTDLVREIGRHRKGITIDFLRASSYADGMSSSNEVRIKKDVDSDIRGANVLLSRMSSIQASPCQSSFPCLRSVVPDLLN